MTSLLNFLITPKPLRVYLRFRYHKQVSSLFCDTSTDIKVYLNIVRVLTGNQLMTPNKFGGEIVFSDFESIWEYSNLYKLRILL